MISSEDLPHELSKNVDSEDMFATFIIEMPKELTDAEKAVKRELGLLRRLRRTLTDINQIKKQEKPKAVRPGEKAKEEAMQLLRSGVISIADKSERHLGKRKSKEHDEDELNSSATPCNTAASAPSTPLKKPNFKSKAFSYKSFLRGDTLYPLNRANSPDTKPSLSAQRETSSTESFFPVRRRRSLSPASPTPTSDSLTEAMAVTAASKRKQQLIALMTEEEEDIDEAATAVGNLSGGGSDGNTAVRQDNVYLGESGSGISLTEGGEQHSQGYRSSMTEAGVTLHVGYHNVTEDIVRELLSPFGTILRIKVSDQQTHAYVTMATREMADRALELDHKMVHNRLLRVSQARKHTPYRRGGVGDVGSGERRHRYPGSTMKNQADRRHYAVPPSLDDTASLDTPAGASDGQLTTSQTAQPRHLVGYGDLFQGN